MITHSFIENKSFFTENNFNQLMNWTYLPIVLVYTKDSKKKKIKVDECFGQRTC